MNYKAILFDFDGVIAHTRPIIQQALWAFFRERQIEVAESEYADDGWVTKSLEQICTMLRENHGIHLEAPDLRTEIWKTQLALMEAGLESDPTLIPFLEYCRNEGIRIAIGSNSGRSRIEWVLEKMGIDKYFLLQQWSLSPTLSKGEGVSPPSGDLGGLTGWGIFAIIWATDITHHKPHPEVWTKCAEMLEVPIDSCLVIEDGLPGLTGTKQCGARAVYYHRFCRPEKACMEIAERSVGSFAELFE